MKDCPAIVLSREWGSPPLGGEHLVENLNAATESLPSVLCSVYSNCGCILLSFWDVTTDGQQKDDADYGRTDVGNQRISGH